jgi:hypothetical protein
MGERMRCDIGDDTFAAAATHWHDIEKWPGRGVDRKRR